MKIRPVYFVIGLLLIMIGIELFYTQIPLSYERTARVMGTTVRVKVKGPGAPHWAMRAIYEMGRIDRLFSKFNPDSEIGLINRLAGRAPLQVSADTFDVLKMAVEINRASKGAFDVTLGRPKALVLDEVNRKVFIRTSNVERRTSGLDLGGIGKGYAVESARRLLLKMGVKSAIIDMHSSIAVIGDGWRVGIRDPREKREEQGLAGTIVLNNGEALSTSGQYEQPGHIIDPRTGRPAKKCLSVTVVAYDAALTDALSTAVFVLGPADGIKLLRKYGAKAFIIDKNGTIYDNLGVKLR